MQHFLYIIHFVLCYRNKADAISGYVPCLSVSELFSLQIFVSLFSFHTLLVFYDEDIAYGLVSMTLSEIEP